MTTNISLQERIAQAAAQTDMNKANNSELVPSHRKQAGDKETEPDLSKLASLELDKHHTRKLYGILKWDGLNGAALYVDKYPEAARIVTKSNPSTFVPKPPGYVDAVAGIVGGWLSDKAALLQTNRQDVIALNASLGGQRFSPDNHFSKPISSSLRKRLEGLFEQRGYILPEGTSTLSKVKQAARAAKAGILPGADAFGSIGILSNRALTIGGETFSIERHNEHGHGCIRLMVNGSRLRLRLDALTEFLRLSGLLYGQAVPTPSFTNVVRGRTGPEGENGHEQTQQPNILPETWPHDGHPPSAPTGELAPDDQAQQVTLSDRIARLTAARVADANYTSWWQDLPDFEPLNHTEDELRELQRQHEQLEVCP